MEGDRKLFDEGRFSLLSEKSPPLNDRIGLNAAEASSNRQGRPKTEMEEEKNLNGTSSFDERRRRSEIFPLLSEKAGERCL